MKIGWNSHVYQIQDVNTAYTTKDQLLQAIDDLPGGVGWKLEKVTLKGDLEDDDGNPIVETLELWYRDPVDCIRELMGNPVFKDVMQYAPQKLFEDIGGKSEIINEMWTADWWWKLQVRARAGGEDQILTDSDRNSSHLERPLLR